MMAAKCCNRCGIPANPVNGVVLHHDAIGGNCSISQFFLQGLFEEAERAGKMPHLFLQEVLAGGLPNLIRVYAAMLPIINDAKRARASEEQNASQQQTQPQQAPRAKSRCVCM